MPNLRHSPGSQPQKRKTIAPSRATPAKDKKLRTEEEVSDDEMPSDVSENSNAGRLTDTIRAILGEFFPPGFKESWAQYTTNVNNLQERVMTLEEEIAALKQGPSGPSNANRQRNLIIGGLIEDKKERPAQLHEKIEALMKVLNIDNLDYDDAFRLGKPQEGKTRVVLLRLLRMRDKWTIFNAKKLLRQAQDAYKNVYINEDETPEQRQNRKKLVEKLKEHKSADNAVVGSIRGPSLHIRKEGKVIHKFALINGKVEEQK